jgi:hypothetical protein
MTSRGEVSEAQKNIIGIIYNYRNYTVIRNKGGEGCEMAREAESKPHGTVNLFRYIPSDVR